MRNGVVEQGGVLNEVVPVRNCHGIKVVLSTDFTLFWRCGTKLALLVRHLKGRHQYSPEVNRPWLYRCRAHASRGGVSF